MRLIENWIQGRLRVILFQPTLVGARSITVSPGTNSTDMVVVAISLCGAPRSGVPIDGGTSVVEDSHVVEGENAGRSLSRALVGDAACTAEIAKLLFISMYLGIVCIHNDIILCEELPRSRSSASHRSRPRPGDLSKSGNLKEVIEEAEQP